MLSKVLSGAVIGIDAYTVEVEIDIVRSLPRFDIVGLPEATVKESKERVKTAICNSGFLFPYDKILVNLAPADIRKEGTGYDLPIAIGILAATHIFPTEILENYLINGELSLDGRVKPVKGSLSIAVEAREKNLTGVIVPGENSREAAVVDGISVIPINHLSELVDFFRGFNNIPPEVVDIDSVFLKDPEVESDFSEVQGQEHVKRALKVAASGGHNLMMIGPPGSGKTMLAKRIPSILPPLTFEEALETTKIYSISGMMEKDQAIVTQRPFRSPHHTISDAGLIGGGRIPRPGEVSLAHNGVLFLDEVAEFRKQVLDVMRQPMENKKVCIARATISIEYPCAFMLVAAMNPCPCGFLSDPNHECSCSHQQIHRYRAKISGPIQDRIDIHVDVPAVPYKDLRSSTPGESSKSIRQHVTSTRIIQLERFKRSKIFCNAQMNSRLIKKYCSIDEASHKLMEKAIDKLGFSARAYNRILKIARTIADLEESKSIEARHISEAIQYRSLDRSKGNFL